jgi:hypothetical protein
MIGRHFIVLARDALEFRNWAEEHGIKFGGCICGVADPPQAWRITIDDTDTFIMAKLKWHNNYP